MRGLDRVKTHLSSPFQAVILSLVGLLLLVAPAGAGPILLSARDAGQQPPAGGNGDSVMPVISPDGRFVLFASSADNLVAATATNAFATTFPARLNVYLRDRTLGTTVPVSVDAAGTGLGNADSLPAMISTNGRYALFESRASNLVAGDTNGSADIFLRDLLAGTNVLVSANTNGLTPNGPSRSPVMTPDARVVAFVSEASDLVAGDTNGIADIFVRDLQTGVTTLASPGATSRRITAQPSASESPLITPDGRFIAFYSTATNLVAGAAATTNGSDIYVRDRLGNVTIWASSGARNEFPLALGTTLHCSGHTLSDDGQFVAYVAAPDPINYHSPLPGVLLRYNLQTGLNDLIYTNCWVSMPPYQDARSLDMTPDGRFVTFVANSSLGVTRGDSIYVWDAATGTTTLASGDVNGQAQTNAFCQAPALDPNGRFVAFVSNGAGLVTNSLQGDVHAYLRDLQSGSTSLLDSDPDGIGSGVSAATSPRLSAGAATVVFECSDGTLFPNDRNHALDLVARGGAGGSIELVSAAAGALVSASANGHSAIAAGGISADGRLLAFVSEADNLVANDTNQCADIFVRDLQAGTNLLVSWGTNGANADGSSSQAVLSGNGRFVAFTSFADNLVTNDANHALDVFERDLALGTTQLISVNSNGISSGNGPSQLPQLSSDGRYVLFLSYAANLVPGTFRASNLFLRDTQVGVTYALTQRGVTAAAMTPDGRYVAFAGQAGGFSAQLYVWDSQAASLVYSNAASGDAAAIGQLAINPAGNRIAYANAPGVEAIDWAANTNWSICPVGFISPGASTFTADGQRLVFSSSTVEPNSPGFNVYVYDFQTRSNRLVSRTYLGGPADASSKAAQISPDGRFVAYESFASNLVPGITNQVANIFLFDVLNNTTTLLSASPLNGPTPEAGSFLPFFSPNGQAVLFESWASGLVPGDFNATSDLLAVSLPAASTLAPFNVQISPSAGASAALLLSWPAADGRTYRLQTKNGLGDLQWLNSQTPVTIVNGQAFFGDTETASSSRFYRVLGF